MWPASTGVMSSVQVRVSTSPAIALYSPARNAPDEISIRTSTTPMNTAIIAGPKRNALKKSRFEPGFDRAAAERPKLTAHVIRIGHVSPQNGPAIGGVQRKAKASATTATTSVRNAHPFRYFP